MHMLSASAGTSFLAKVCVAMCVCVCLYNPKSSVNALKIVRSTEPQQIDKNTNGRMKMHYYYWVEKHFVCMHFTYLLSRGEQPAKEKRDGGRERVQQNSVHLISSNKSDLLLVKTFYLHIHWSISPLSALLLLTSSENFFVMHAFEKYTLTSLTHSHIRSRFRE